MKCSQCKLEKLSKEFPPTTITEKCQHISSLCLRCLITQIDKVQNKQQAKCPECQSVINPQEMKALNLAWEKAPFKIDVESIGRVHPPIVQLPEGGSLKGDFYIVMLNGQKVTMKLEENKTVIALRGSVNKQLRVNQTKQKLIYRGKELEDTQQNRASTLADYGIGPGSHIQLIVVLYSITRAESIKSLTFDLSWGYPVNGAQDYLDGSCLLYAGDTFWRKYDYASVYYPSFPHMRHSGDVMDNTRRTGSQRITAKLDQLPPEVTQLYFVLSSWKSPTIGHFQRPSFKLFDETQPDKDLCNYTLGEAANSQAVIMCCVSRVGNTGMWQVIRIGKLSAGNANDYDPIEISIVVD
ncbi:513_t:CDS:2 [Scutellospora calospora]|uniref:513_t:CDS:1 n=1 Tax=Scutellospora calospora TaxID=85575 RepID=A0ACA9L0Q3_9GLOM|nr:513_t:CDS:2 [Scutellospora calospora]